MLHDSILSSLHKKEMSINELVEEFGYCRKDVLETIEYLIQNRLVNRVPRVAETYEITVLGDRWIIENESIAKQILSLKQEIATRESFWIAGRKSFYVNILSSMIALFTLCILILERCDIIKNKKEPVELQVYTIKDSLLYEIILREADKE